MNHNQSALGDGVICFIQETRWSRGIFFGDNPFDFSTPVLLAQLSCASLITNVIQYLITPLGEGVFVAQILTGLLLGPLFLGGNKIFKKLVFPISALYVSDTIAYFGLMLFLYIVGVKTDLNLLRKSGKKAVAIGLSAFTVPLLLNFLLGFILTHSVPMEPKLHRSLLWISSFQAMSSFHVIACLLADLKLVNSEIGRLAISASMISGTCSWFWSGIVFTGKQSVTTKEQYTLVLMLAFVAGMLFFILTVFRPMLLWMIRHTTSDKSLKESYICIIFLMILASAMFGEIVGQHFLFGPMILGMFTPDGPPLGSALVNKLDLFVSTILLPIYFVISGASLNFTSISLRNFTIIEIMAFFSVCCKVGAVMLTSIYSNMPVNDALYLGLILSNQGITDVMVIGRASELKLIDKQSYTIMLFSIVLFTGIIAPMIKFCYKPSWRYESYARRTIQSSTRHTELRILACIHYPEQTHSIISLLEASYPNPYGPVCLYVIHLLDLEGRTAPILVAHNPRKRNASHVHQSEHIINALRLYEQENRGNITIYPFTAISPYASMHEDVCTLAYDKKVTMIILPFHKLPVMHVSSVEAKLTRSVNCNIMQEAPCSVGILIDRSAINGKASMLSRASFYNIGVLFIGGVDDREALAYANRMAKHPSIGVTLIRFLEPRSNPTSSVDKQHDDFIVSEFRDMKKKFCIYQEELVKDSVGVVSVIRKSENCFDLILVGRHHEDYSMLLAGLTDWNEFPELGCIGDMLAASDSSCKASVLVVQAPSRGTVIVDSPKSIVVNMPWDNAKAWPAS